MVTTDKKQNKKIAVIGGGVFGCTTAITLAREGFSVDLFEKGSDIMQAASGINQYRMHRGYHYPRSAETITSCSEATPEFEAEYADAIVDTHTHYYAIAKDGSFLSGQEYLAVLDKHHLPYKVVKPAHINHDAVDVVVEASENLYDPYVLTKVLRERLASNAVQTHFNRDIDVDDLSEYDFVVVATYAASNSVFDQRPEAQREYQFEVCEKIVIETPKEMEGVSTVVMDGPFTCFDPLGNTDTGVMGHVVHAIHHTSIGVTPDIPHELREYLNNGIIEKPKNTRASLFLEAASYFMPSLKDAKHVGSMFTVRTVLPRVDDTDTRPTIVSTVDDRIITIYSGKVGNSVRAARDALALIKSRQ
ncbi:MAG: hypothetical protein ACI92I_000377 [Acidimicrobiales bacterium]|jgi:hypothetical protein